MKEIKTYPQFKSKYEGKIYPTKYGDITIVEYHHKSKVLVHFEDGTEVITRMTEIRNGTVKNPNLKNVWGIGCIGQGIYDSVNSKVAYSKWSAMLQRCTGNRISYKDSNISEEWLNFQNFAKWFEKNYNPEIMQNWHLDKDLLCPDCKTYSPENCCFLPLELNSIISKKTNSKRENTGITFKQGKYFSYISNKGSLKYLGGFENINDAKNAYIKAKKEKISDLANKWIAVLREDVYRKLIEFEPYFKE